MSRVLVLGLAVLFAVGLGLVSPASAQTREETLIYALQSDIDNWDPPNSVLREAIILGYHVFDHLAVRDLKTRKVMPNLATSWKAVDDTTWEVKLRQGVKFHDGTPFTAKDVKATFDRVLDPTKKMTARGNHAKIKTVEIVDDYTVRFKTDGPYPLFVERLTAQVMQSDKVIREKGHEWMQENPVGTGPYKLAKWSRKQEHLLVRNDDYWGAKPAFKYVRVRIIPEQATQIAELLSGGVDIIKAVPPDQMDVIDKSGTARTATSPILRTAMLQLDQAARSGPNPFTDKRVRQAANMATDMDGIIKHVLNGLGDRTATGINPMAFGWDAGLKPYKQDLAGAKKLLADAGYPNGFEATFKVAPQYYYTVRSAEIIVNQLAKVGIRAKIQQVEWGQWLAQVFCLKPCENPDYDMSIIGHAEAWDIGNFANPKYYFRWDNADFQKLFKESEVTVDDRKRREQYVRMQQMLADEAPAVWLYMHPRLVVTKKGVTGIWKDLPIPSLDLSEVGWQK